MNGFQIDAVHNAFAEKDAEIAQLKEENNERVLKLMAEIVAMRAQIEVLRAALQFYADDCGDTGLIARRALETKP
jgi:hypothetical protein